MVIGVPKEVKQKEFRVGLLPSAAYQLIRRGHQVVVERDAGTGSGYPDEDYENLYIVSVPSVGDASVLQFRY